MTIRCSNCINEAQFQYNITPSSSIAYCALHLPKFLRGKSPAALLVSKIEAPAPKKKTAKVVEPVVEEPTEETVEETDGAS